MDEEFEIYLSDLKPKARNRVLEFLGLNSAEEGNLDVLPLTTIPKPEIEDANNVEFLCEECGEKRYPDKGSFTKERLKSATHVKKRFGKEHMWVKIKQLEDDCIVGTVDNVPVFKDSPKFGEKVNVSFHEVEDVL
jgi:hypothetical protein